MSEIAVEGNVVTEERSIAMSITAREDRMSFMKMSNLIYAGGGRLDSSRSLRECQ